MENKYWYGLLIFIVISFIIKGIAKGSSDKRKKVNNITSEETTKVFIITQDDDENILNWSIIPTDLETIPNEDNHFLVKGIDADKNNYYLSICCPERIVSHIIAIDSNNKVYEVDCSLQDKEIIPVVASDCYGDYELYYTKSNPSIGIDVLKHGLDKATDKSVPLEDLGYILRDENRIIEAIEAFEQADLYGVSSEYIYWELAELYRVLNQSDKVDFI